MMEHSFETVKMDDQMELPPGFRFHPTDEELITHYLLKKDLDVNFSAIAIGEVDMNKVEPWELPWKAKLGEKEWYFFCVRDKKYPTGLRTNRATAAGYWKATGKDKEIFRGKTLVGMKKTLVFYKGRAPKGVKSNWVNHEYRLDGNNHRNTAKNEWVISRVFHKTTGGKKVHISGLMRMNPLESEPTLPPLMDPPPYTTRIKPDETEGHVHCFSNSMTSIHNPVFAFSSNPIGLPWEQFQNGLGSSFPGMNRTEDPSTFGALLENHGLGKEQEMVSVSQETAVTVSTDQESALSNLEMGKRLFEGQNDHQSIGQHDLACMWTY